MPSQFQKPITKTSLISLRDRVRKSYSDNSGPGPKDSKNLLDKIPKKSSKKRKLSLVSNNNPTNNDTLLNTVSNPTPFSGSDDNMQSSNSIPTNLAVGVQRSTNLEKSLNIKRKILNSSRDDTHQEIPRDSHNAKNQKTSDVLHLREEIKIENLQKMKECKSRSMKSSNQIHNIENGTLYKSTNSKAYETTNPKSYVCWSCDTKLDASTIEIDSLGGNGKLQNRNILARADEDRSCTKEKSFESRKIENPESQLSISSKETSEQIKPRNSNLCPSLYAVHVHPILKVMTCSMCADKAYAVEDDVQTLIQAQNREENYLDSEKREAESNVCSWCAGMRYPEQNKNEYKVGCLAVGEIEDDITHFMCDDCPRVFCESCIVLANGGGEEGWIKTKKLAEDDGHWSCIYCEEPKMLSDMRIHLNEKLATMKAKGEGYDSIEKGGDDNLSSIQEKVLIELENAENELNCIETIFDELENQPNIKSEEFRSEIMLSILNGNRIEIGKDEIEVLVKKELDTYIEMWKDHRERVVDTIGNLQSQFEDCGLNVTSFYKNYEENKLEEKDPDWKIKADSELDQRDVNDGLQKGFFKGSSGYQILDDRDLDELSEDELNDLEEINTLEGAMRVMGDIALRNCSQWGATGVSERDAHKLKKLIPKEDSELAEMNVQISKRNCTEVNYVEREEKSNRNEAYNNGNEPMIVLRELNQIRKIKPRNKRKGTHRHSNTKESKPQDLPESDVRPKVKSKTRLKPHLISEKPNIPENAVNDQNIINFEDSPLILSRIIVKKKSKDKGYLKTRRPISIVEPLFSILKDHQKAGIRFMWDNTCSNIMEEVNLISTEGSNIRGCILAHNMGLGKSLQILSLLHCLLTHPLLVSNITNNRIIHKVLLIVPVNTLTNWENEFDLWIKKKDVPKFDLFNLNETSSSSLSRKLLIEKWANSGGVMLSSEMAFSRFNFYEKKSDAGEEMLDLYKSAFLSPGPDLVVLDEAHLMLKNNKSFLAKDLSSMETIRRITLTGTPMQNNLKEYYNMINWVKPNCLGTEIEFDRNYDIPISESLLVDTSDDVKEKGERLSKELWGKLKPFVQRLDSSILAKDLPFMQQAVIHIRLSKIQVKLNRAFRDYQKRANSNNFFDAYHKLFPVNNHPGCLLIVKQQRHNSPPYSKSMIDTDKIKNESKLTSCGKNDMKVRSSEKEYTIMHSKTDTNGFTHEVIDLMESDYESDSDKCEVMKIMSSKIKKIPGPRNESEASNLKDDSLSYDFPGYIQNDGTDSSPIIQKHDHEEKWWEKVYRCNPHMGEIQSGGKVVILLQILAHCDFLGDKVVIFSQCLKTLDYIESILNKPNWGSKIPSISSICPGKTFGSWRKEKEYLRIDGSTKHSHRGSLVDQFNEKTKNRNVSNTLMKNLEDNSKVFLISSKAGGVGTNLCGANRVVLFDSHWNPTVDLQALCRCYRYGQTKPVYVYRLLMEGTMEEKVYSRSVNKSNLAARVIDQRFAERSFTSYELSNILETDNWVQCDKCDKWRMLPPDTSTDIENLPDKWYCEMNIDDRARSKCSAKERDAKYYAKFFQDRLVRSTESGSQDSNPPIDTAIARESIDDKPIEDLQKTESTNRDQVLSRLLSIHTSITSTIDERIEEKTSKSDSLISKYYFHESLLKDSSPQSESKSSDLPSKKVDIIDKHSENKKEKSTVDSPKHLIQNHITSNTQDNHDDLSSGNSLEKDINGSKSKSFSHYLRGGNTSKSLACQRSLKVLKNEILTIEPTERKIASSRRKEHTNMSASVTNSVGKVKSIAVASPSTHFNDKINETTKSNEGIKAILLSPHKDLKEEQTEDNIIVIDDSDSEDDGNLFNV